MNRRFFVVPILLVAACGGGKRPATSAPGDATGGGDSAGGTASLPADAPPGTPAPEAVSFVTEDGITIAATYYGPADAATTACAVFAHQLSSTRAEWQPIVDRLRGRAHLLAFDLRGHGASTTGSAGTVIWKGFETADWEKLETDVATAVELIAGKGADRACALIGSSIGSTAVLRYAGANPDRASALVLLSPGLAYRGVRTPDAARASRAPVLIVHSQENGAADAAGALAGIWRDATPPVAVEVIADAGQAHGMKIVTGDPTILERVVTFLADTRP